MQAGEKTPGAVQGGGKIAVFKFSTWWQRKRIEAKVRLPGRRVQIQRVVNPYHAVSIEAGPGCCETARNFAGRRFLTWEAPSVPQPTCDVAACHCRYLHYDDRRDRFDRRHRDACDGGSELAKGANRRGGRGRRVTDRFPGRAGAA